MFSVSPSLCLFQQHGAASSSIPIHQGLNKPLLNKHGQVQFSGNIIETLYYPTLISIPRLTNTSRTHIQNTDEALHKVLDGKRFPKALKTYILQDSGVKVYFSIEEAKKFRYFFKTRNNQYFEQFKKHYEKAKLTPLGHFQNALYQWSMPIIREWPSHQGNYNVIVFPENIHPSNHRYFERVAKIPYKAFISDPKLYPKLISHELGHLVASHCADYLYNNWHIECHEPFDLAKAFRSTVDEDYRQWKKQGFPPIDSDVVKNPHWVKKRYINRNVFHRYYPELWAELFSAQYGGGSSLNTQDLLQYFPKSAAVVRKQIETFCQTYEADEASLIPKSAKIEA